MKATTLGMKNLERVSGYLLPATEVKGDDWEQLQRVYGRLLGQWSLEMGHVAAIPGGYDSRQVHGGQKGVRFTAVPRERQQQATKFLLDNAFHMPAWVTNQEVLLRIEPEGTINRVRTAQQRVMTVMFAPARLNRLVEQEAAEGAKAYPLADYMGDIRKGVFSELAAPSVKVDAYRRNTQRIYLELMNERLNGKSPASDDARAIIRAELKTLGADTTRALPRAADRTTRAHLDDMKDQIATILDPKFPPQAPAAAAATPARRGADRSDSLDCWPDYGIYGLEPLVR